MPAIPIIGAGVSIFKGIQDARNASRAAKGQEGLMAAQQQLMGQQSGLAQEMSKFARNQADMSQPALQKAMQYYQTLASGTRGAMSAALAPDIARANEVYSGAQRGLSARMAPGPQRDRAIADLYRDRAGKMALMPFQARGAAVGEMAGLGKNYLSSALDAYRGAGSALSGASGTASAASQTGVRAQYSRNQANDQWGNMITGGTQIGQDVWDWYKRSRSPLNDPFTFVGPQQ